MKLIMEYLSSKAKLLFHEATEKSFFMRTRVTKMVYIL